MILSFVLLVVGFVLLVKGADFFVDGSSSIAKFLKIPSIVIGLTIVAFGTSAPEAAVSIIAGINGSNGIAVGNVIGSNMFNLLVVLGVSAAIKPVNIEGQIIKRDFPFMLLATFAFAVVSFDVTFGNGTENVISRNEAVILLILMAIFLYSVITSALRTRKENAASLDEEKPKYGMGKSLIFTVGGLAGIIFGGQLVVDSAEKIALGFGMSETLVGLTIVAVGTSLPELVTSIVAAKKGESDIAIGNVVGSNVFNVLFVLAASAAITPMSISGQSLVDLVILTAVTVLTYVFCVTQKKINRPEGVILVLMYVAYMAYAIVR
ncbi:MAG: calcium/sodium antiporter [Ruminococcus sp.]|nr:calcium/sodium antiporter [Ruminococcus sp.]MCM1381017.1 calcium/sodium antiporter [Muribaculaceae bacterium]MCM1480585.1 calcium/sodium antiporter [Muribaculaceae bacterium]